MLILYIHIRINSVYIYSRKVIDKDHDHILTVNLQIVGKKLHNILEEGPKYWKAKQIN